MLSIASLIFCASLGLHFVAVQAQSGSGGLVVSSDDKKREELRWFPADNISDCDAEPGLEQVREGRPSLACREDDERFACAVELTDRGRQPGGFSVEHVTYPSSWTGGRG